MSKFQVGDEVVRVSDITRHTKSDNYYKRKVIAIEGNSYIVEFLPTWQGKEDIRVLAEGEIVSREDANKISASLEVEFNALKDEVAAKLNQAAVLIKEAVNIANNKHTTISDMYGITSNLMDALDSAGWASSSFSC